VTIERLEDRLHVAFVDRILFDFGKASISPSGRRILRMVGKTLNDVHSKRIRIIGHTDTASIHPEYRYKYPSNWELSAARAASVVRFLQKECGVNPWRMEAVGRSFYDSTATNLTEEGRAENRRVEIVIAPDFEAD
jgi:chemotaxis protein MotB